MTSHQSKGRANYPVLPQSTRCGLRITIGQISTMGTLKETLEIEIAASKKRALRNYRLAKRLSIIATIISIIAGVSVSGSFFPTWALAILTSFPAALLAL